MRYALGIDGGGSKCDAVLVDETGAVVGWGRGGAIHVYYDPPEAVSASYRSAVAGAVAGKSDLEVWVAGAALDGQPPEALAAAGKVVGYVRATEVDTAFASVQEEWGLVVLSGTGSFVHGRSSDGRDLHWGGLGPVLNDYGSAYEIGLRGLRAAFASGWTESRRTTLVQVIPEALGAPHLRAVFRLVYVENMGRRQIASLARVVNREAEAGDRVARECLERAADELGALGADMLAELGMCDLSFPVIAIGSVAQRSAIWWQRVCRRLAEAAPGTRPVIPQLQPAVGAALLALREMGVPWTPALIARLVETQAIHRPSD